MKIMISEAYDIRRYWYQKRYQRRYIMISTYDIRRYWYHSQIQLICIWYLRQNHTRIAQGMVFIIAFYDIMYDIIQKINIIYDIIHDIIVFGNIIVAQGMGKVWYHIWYHGFLYDITYDIVYDIVTIYMISCMIS